MLPYVAVLERRTSAPFHAFDCRHCRSTTPREVRQRMLCGWEHRDTWPATECTGDLREDDPKRVLCRCDFCTAGRGRMVPGCDVLPTVCPGYTHRLPQVQQAARAHFWATECGGNHRWEPTEVMLDLIEVYHSSRSMAESYEVQERQREAKNKSDG